MILYSIDPGVHSVGWAMFDGACLKSCGLDMCEKDAQDQSARLSHDTSNRLSLLEDKNIVLVVEVPQVYRGSRSKGNPNDLIDVAFVAGAVAGRHFNTKKVWPHQWKGTLPKVDKLENYLVHRRNTNSLSMKEQEAYGKGLLSVPQRSLRHNVADAVGIGIWALTKASFFDIPKK